MNLDNLTIYNGNATDELKKIDDETVHTCITSPPYYGLRSYYDRAVTIDPNLTEEKKQEVLQEMKKRGIDAKL